MGIYHTAFDLSQFYGWNIHVLSGAWIVGARITAVLFLLLSGISASLSYAKTGAGWGRHFRRFATLAVAALMVSAATYVANPETFVRFGILHLIAASALLLPFFKRLRLWTIPVGIVVIGLSYITADLTANTSLLLPLGIRPEHFQSVDYFPLVPWFGVVLTGYGMGYMRYIQYGKGTARDNLTTHYPHLTAALTWPGRHALLVYLLHQPLIMAVLWVTLGKPSL